MYTTSWCPDCIRAKKLLNEQKIEFIEIDIDQDKEAKAFVKTFNQGRAVIPTIFFPDGTTSVEPSNQEMIEKLGL